MYIETKNLVKTFSGRNVVDGVSLRVDKGQVVGLLGPNGAGKTTSFYMIVGIERPSSGIITVDGKDITTGKQIRHLRTQSGMTQEELAGELNVTRQALSNWERDV
ncbi:MAG: ATP-binding cassette domain-containing protein, partial [Veillonella parvula]